MNIAFDRVLHTATLVGAELPAYKALFDQVVELFSPATQDELKARYAEAIKTSDAAHRRAQED